MTESQFCWRIIIPGLGFLALAFALNAIGGYWQAMAMVVSNGGIAIVFGANLLWAFWRRNHGR